MYLYPGWRRIVFVAVLLVVLVLTLTPSITQGTIKIHVYGLTGAGAIDHLFVGFKSLQFHTFGFAANTGWVSLNQSTAAIDLVRPPGQYLPETVESAPITSGRYDAIRLVMTNSTAQVGTKSFSLSNTPVLDANFTLPISPNGFGDVLLLLSFDYALILQNPGTLSIQIVQTSVV
jgi:Domain of unknown function (DUF4382)